jgi:hypothetical protein
VSGIFIVIWLAERAVLPIVLPKQSVKSICYLSDCLFAEGQLVVAQVDAFLDGRGIGIEDDARKFRENKKRAE